MSTKSLPRLSHESPAPLSGDDIFDGILMLGRAGQYPKTGSFGEHIFAFVAQERGHRVERMHRNSIDFIVDGIPVDVKTPPSRMGEQLMAVARWPGKRMPDVTYAVVEVTRAALRVTWEGHFSEELTWDRVGAAAQAWVNRDGLDLEDAAERVANDAAWEVARADLEAYFAERGIPCEAIQRTVQSRFKDESPGNLVLKSFAPGALRVFVSYRRFVRDDAVEYVIAFPSHEAPNLSMRPKHENKLGIEKVDLRALPARYRFESPADLRLNYARAYRES